VFGASRLLTTHGETIANGVHDIVPGLSFPVIVANFGTREVFLRQRASFGYVELLTTGGVQVPRAAPTGASAVPAFTTPTTMKGVVGAVTGTRDPPGPGGDSGAAVTAGGGAATPARPRDPGEAGPSQGGAPPVASAHVEDVDLPDANPALHTRVRHMMGQHKAMWTGQAMGVIKATQHRIDLNSKARPVRFAHHRAGQTARGAETAEVKRQFEADVIEPTSSEWSFPVVLVP